jgi:hypothetical protein
VGQVIPAGLLVTEPDPEPARTTLSVNGTAVAGRAQTRPNNARVDVTTNARLISCPSFVAFPLP